MWIDLRRVLPSHTIGEDCPLTNLSPSHEPKLISPRHHLALHLSSPRLPLRDSPPLGASPSPRQALYRARPFPTILESETFPWPWMNSPQLSRPRLPSPTALGFSRSRPHTARLCFLFQNSQSTSKTSGVAKQAEVQSIFLFVCRNDALAPKVLRALFLSLLRSRPAL